MSFIQKIPGLTTGGIVGGSTTATTIQDIIRGAAGQISTIYRDPNYVDPLEAAAASANQAAQNAYANYQLQTLPAQSIMTDTVQVGNYAVPKMTFYVGVAAAGLVLVTLLKGKK